MADKYDSNAYKLISTSSASRNRLLKLADGIKTRKKSSTHTITNTNNKKSSNNAYDRAHTNIEHLVYGTYKARPQTPLTQEDNHSNVPSNRSQPNSPISETNSESNQSICQCSVHSKLENSNNLNNSQNCFDSALINSCNNCNKVSIHQKSPESSQNEFDLKLTNDDMDLDSDFNHNDSSLIISLQELTTSDKSVVINSKIPQPIPRKTKNLSTSTINSSTVKQINTESFDNSYRNPFNLSDSSIDKEVNESIGSDSPQDNAQRSGSKPLSKISHIPKPLFGLNTGMKNFESFQSFDSFTDKINVSNNKLTKIQTNSSINGRSIEIPVIPNLQLLKNNKLSSFGMPVNQSLDHRFAKIRSTINANKRMPSLYTNSLRRHNSLLETKHKPLSSYHNRSLQSKNFNDKSEIFNSRFVKESRISNTSIVKSQYSSFSTESRKSKSDRSVTHSSSYTKVIESFSSQNDDNEVLDSSKKEVLKTKSHSNLQRNRPQVKTSVARIRVPIKSRSNSVPDNGSPAVDRGVNRAASDSTSNSSHKEQIMSNNKNDKNLIDSNQLNYDSERFAANYNSKLSRNSRMMNMFIMDEDYDNIPVSPKKLSKFDYGIQHKDRKSKNSDENSFDNSMFKQHLYETYVNKSPSSGQSSPDHKNVTPNPAILRARSSSDHHLSALLLSEAQKEAIHDIKKPINEFNKSSRPWSHIYSESEAKRILRASKTLGDSIDNSSDLVTTYKPKSENDILTSHLIEKLPISPVKSNSSQECAQESVLQRFKKTFSLRFSRNSNQVNQRTDSPSHSKFYSTLRTKSEETPETNEVFHSHDSRKGEYFEKSEDTRDSTNDNLNIRRLSNTDRENLKNKLTQMPSVERQFSTPYPIKARDQTYRKSLIRKHSHRARLRRSVSHPHNFEKWANTNKILKRENSGRTSSETESESDSLGGNRHSSASRQSSEQQEFDDDIVYAEALWDHTSLDPEELSFRAGEVIDITDSSHKDWWWGSILSGTDTRCGWLPASFVRPRVNQDDTLEECMTKIADGTLTRTPKRRLSISKLSNEQVRANVVLEIIHTERDFVKHLKDVIDGYLIPCRNRTDMFTEESIRTIFSNIEQLYEFQRHFLDQLELCINWEQMSNSLIGECFFLNEKRFIVYCEFCKNHPLAISELQDLYTNEKYVAFFEGCRLMQNMIDISLDGFLLTPIQKICKYPLQLGELLKYTRTDHEDYIPVSNAYACMQRVAQLVNERKRRFESLQQLISLQESIDGFEGPHLIDTSTVTIHSGEVNRLTSSWSKDGTLFLFDHLLVYCKKDSGILKRANYIFKTRVEISDKTLIVDIKDGTKDTYFNINAKNCFKIFSEPNQKWYLFQTKTTADKENWIKAFDDERKRVNEDAEQGFVVTENDKRGAKMAHLNSLKPKKPRIKRTAKSKRPDTAVVELSLDTPNGFEIDRNRAGSLPSYMHSEKNVINNSKLRQPVSKKNRSNWFHLGSSRKSKPRIKRSLK